MKYSTLHRVPFCNVPIIKTCNKILYYQTKADAHTETNHILHAHIYSSTYQ